MAQKTWTQTFYWFVRLYLSVLAPVHIGIAVPKDIAASNGFHWSLVPLGVALWLLSGWLLLPRHTKFVGQLLYEFWLLAICATEQEPTET